MTQTKALKLALEALDNLMYWDNGKPDYDDAREAITAIKEALTQEKALQALHDENERLGLYKESYAKPDQEPVGFAVMQKPWVGLDHHDRKTFSSWLDYKSDDEVFNAIEAKLKELNT